MIVRLWIFSIFLISCYSNLKISQVEQEGWQLIWSDEFNDAGLPDSTKWSYDIGDACDKPAGCGWGNNELQYYTEKREKNARVEDGKLIIETHAEDYKSRAFTSARLVTKGKGDWKYGKFVTRAKLPAGKGVWSAIWMLSTDRMYGGWPRSGEIDIIENVGFNPERVVGTIHTAKYNHMKGTHRNGDLQLADAQQEFHDYILEWNEEEMIWFVDDVEIFRYPNESTGYEAWPFDQRFHLILNIAYGGNWGGRQGIAPEALPARMEVDYVRVYQTAED
ncbi:glycoside hydrolase family 16 protein [Portibacter marinus]|uniref:glycoside hydrolase family 16 protein n=1 Tax=Portibacter marinus TaxID=2898660 RepID=UPI001F2B2F8C|nr:glycoside hydrolase family 16 protein [Portibacter marinus]